MAVLTATGHSQTIVWGNDLSQTKILLDSPGNNLSSVSFTFELGTFATSTGELWTPNSDNMDAWFSHWYMFGSSYMSDETFQVEAESVVKKTDIVFFGKPAYMWIRNSKPLSGGGSEWLLVESATWDFPAPKNCCNNADTWTWHVEDLKIAEIVPLDGAQQGYKGSGEYNYIENPIALQTAYPSLPEPSSAVMVVVISLSALVDRRRRWVS